MGSPPAAIQAWLYYACQAIVARVETVFSRAPPSGTGFLCGFAKAIWAESN